MSGFFDDVDQETDSLPVQLIGRVMSSYMGLEEDAGGGGDCNWGCHDHCFGNPPSLPLFEWGDDHGEVHHSTLGGDNFQDVPHFDQPDAGQEKEEHPRLRHQKTCDEQWFQPKGKPGREIQHPIFGRDRQPRELSSQLGINLKHRDLLPTDLINVRGEDLERGAQEDKVKVRELVAQALEGLPTGCSEKESELDLDQVWYDRDYSEYCENLHQHVQYVDLERLKKVAYGFVDQPEEGATCLDGVILNDQCQSLVLEDGCYEKEVPGGAPQHAQWKVIKAVGAGAFGSCLKSMDITSRKNFCAKQIPRHKYDPGEAIALAQSRGHSGVVQILGVLSGLQDVYVLMEYIDGVSLDTYLRRQPTKQLDTWTMLHFSRQAMNVLVFLKERRVVHNDLQCSNWMLTYGDGGLERLKLVDLGLAQVLPDAESDLLQVNPSPMGAPILWSPEKARSERYGFSADLWAYWITSIQQVAGADRYPWHDCCQAAQIMFTLGMNKRNPVEYAPIELPWQLTELLEEVFSFEVDDRPTVEMVLRHPVFDLLYESQDNPLFWTHIEQCGSQMALFDSCHSATTCDSSGHSNSSGCHSNSSILSDDRPPSIVMEFDDDLECEGPTVELQRLVLTSSPRIVLNSESSLGSIHHPTDHQQTICDQHRVLSPDTQLRHQNFLPQYRMADIVIEEPEKKIPSVTGEPLSDDVVFEVHSCDGW